jgi:multiple antibiotic resistance protein
VIESILLTLAALLPVVNPLGSAPIFLAMSADLPAAARRNLAWVVARNACLLLAAAMLVGSYVLEFFGISLPIVRVAGGLVVLGSGWQLLHAGHAAEESPKVTVVEAWEREVGRRGFYPLTFPLTVGPGSISIAITLGARATTEPAVRAMFLAADLLSVTIIGVAIYLSYRYASQLISRLGETGTNVFLRLSAFIMLCIGVAILWGGILGLIEPLRR